MICMMLVVKLVSTLDETTCHLMCSLQDIRRLGNRIFIRSDTHDTHIVLFRGLCKTPTPKQLVTLVYYMSGTRKKLECSCILHTRHVFTLNEQNRKHRETFTIKNQSQQVEKTNANVTSRPDGTL